jgi:hypothetical protein
MGGKGFHPELGILDKAFLEVFGRGVDRFGFSGWGKSS